MMLFEKLRRLFYPVKPTHKCESQRKLYETPYLSKRVGCKHCFTKHGTFGTSKEILFCARAFYRYFAVKPTDTFKLVAYEYPSKHRYAITIVDVAYRLMDITITIDGRLYQNFLFSDFQRFLHQMQKQLGTHKFYVECEIQ